MARWVFTDPVSLEQYSFDVNPNAGGTPVRQKNIVTKNTSAPDGRAIVFEGREEVQEGEISGVILREAQFNVLNEWYDKRHQVYMTDDLGRTFTIYITGFDAKRERAIHYPWKHSYTLKYLIVDWV